MFYTRHISFCAPALVLACALFTARAATGSAPVHNVDGSFVREWLILGPFPSLDLEFDFLADAGGEAGIRPQEGETVVRSDGTRLVWTRFRSPDPFVNLERIVDLDQESVIYAYCDLATPEPLETYARSFSGAATEIRLNGTVVGAMPFTPEQDFESVPVLPLPLEAGRNRCLVKIQGGRVETSFFFQPIPAEHGMLELHVVDPAGRSVAGASVQFYAGGRPQTFYRTDQEGKLLACLYPLAEAYDVQVNSGEMGVWLFDATLRAGERRRIELSLTNAVSIAGQVLATDRSPQNAVPVQAVRVSTAADGDRSEAALSSGSSVPGDRARGVREQAAFGKNLALPPFSQTVFSDTNGQVRFVNLRPGRYRLRAHGADGFVSPNSRGSAREAEVVSVEFGRTFSGIEFVLPEIKKGVWKSFPVVVGLREVQPTMLHRARDRLLWIGTDESFVQTFDGIELKTVAAAPDVPANYITSLAQAADGTVWIGTRAGVARRVAGRIETIFGGGGAIRSRVTAIVPEPDGTVWYAGDFGLSRHDGHESVQYTTRDGLPGKDVHAFMRTRSGEFWLAARAGLGRFDGQTFSLRQPVPELLLSHTRRLYESRDGAIWLATPRGAFRYDGRTLSRLGMEHGLISNDVFDIAETPDGDLWFGTMRGLSRFNGTTVVNYTEKDGLSNHCVRKIHVDEDGVLWCANGWGVSRYDPNSFIGFTLRDGLSNGDGPPGVFDFEPDPAGGTWIGAGWAGVIRLDRTTTQLLSPPGERYYVRQIYRSHDGVLWFGASHGIARYKHGRIEPVLGGNWVIALAGDRDGYLWSGHGWNGGGLIRWNPKTGESERFTTGEGLPDDSVWSLAPSSDGGLWIGTSGGLARYKDGVIEDFRETLGIPTGGVFHLRCDDEGTLWIGSRLGLHLWREGHRVSLTATNGLPDPHIWSSARTGDGTIWMGTDHHGLLGYDGRALTVIDKRDGLLGNHVISILKEPDDSLLLGFNEGGLSRYTPANTPPSARMNAIQLNGRAITNQSSLRELKTGDHITFLYQEIDFKTHPEKRQFWYLLADGAGKTVFSGVTKDRRFDWNPENAGTYTFEVQAIDRDLNYSEPVQVEMKVALPWSANPWFLAPAIAAFGSLLAWAFVARALYVRKNREALVLRERVRIARDLHDHLGAGLTHLAMMGDLVRQQAGQPDTVEMLAERLTTAARNLTRTMGEVIWTTDPDKDTLQSFALFLTSYAERYFAESNVRLRFEIPSKLPNLMLPAEIRSGLLTVIKEALNNAAKHSQATELRIELELNGGDLLLRFEDNGRGFVRTDVAGDGRGLANMQERLSDLGGAARIESAAGKGTRIDVRLPMPKK